ncbi:MAG: MFS transporter [bacterium]|nr:MFS transporter [bacterium]
MSSVNRNVKLLGVSFLLIFFGFDGIQQYVTTFFTNLGLRSVGFVSLVIIYLVFTAANPLGAVIVSTIGAKRSMLFAVGFYTLYCFALMSAVPLVIYAASALLGIAAAVLWTAQNTYLIRASDATVYGANAGFFSTMFSIGAALGVVLMGLLVPILGFRTGFILFAVVPLLALIPLAYLADIRGEVRDDKWRMIGKALRSKTSLRIAAVWFPFNFIQGLVIGVLPLEITTTVGIVQAVGVLMGLFYIAPMVSAYALGRLSDRIGRERMIHAMYGMSILGVGLLIFGRGNPIVLVVAMVTLAVNFGLSRTITFALVGDIATDRSVEAISALTWIVQTIATTAALFLSIMFEGRAVYAVSLVGIIFSYFVFFPVRQLSLGVVRQRIAEELEE